MILRRLRPAVITALVLAAEVGAVAELHRLGSVEGLAVRWDDIGGWLAEMSADDALVALVRFAALVIAWWLLASTALYVAGSVLRLRWLLHNLRSATLPSVRRVVDGIVAGSIVASSTLTTGGPAFAQAPPVPSHAYEPRPAGDMPGYSPMPAGDAPAPTAAPTSTTTVAASSGPATAPPSAAQPADRMVEVSTPLNSARTYRVAAGDNFWSIAERHLSDSTGRPIADLSHDELRAYWLRLIETNRSRLASGDPDLIYPGEVVVLPDVAER